MNNSTSPFIPMGPLRYLIMTADEKDLLGLYTYSLTGETVLKGWLDDIPIYCWPTGIQLSNLLENRIEVHEALTDMRKTKEDLTLLSNIESFWFSLRYFLEMPNTIMKLEDVIVHPNFYYIFKQHRSS